MKRSITAETYVGNFGQTVDYFFLQGCFDSVPSAGDFSVENGFSDISNLVPCAGITGIEKTDNGIRLYADGMKFGPDFSVVCTDSRFSFSKGDITGIRTRGADDFAFCTWKGMNYRLFVPEDGGKHPMIVFFHGAGETGTDNARQIKNCFGAAYLHETYPDCIILAPQNPPRSSFRRIEGRPPEGLPDSEGGWNRIELDKTAEVMVSLMDRGVVDTSRVYATGMSMGGAGTLRMLGLHRDLFTAAAPICPTMLQDTYRILTGLTDFPIWISTAYIDHTYYRHLYIARGIEELKKQGNTDAHVTLYSLEDLKKYNIGQNPLLTEAQLVGENHFSWVLTLRNEYGIMDWLLSRQKPVS